MSAALDLRQVTDLSADDIRYAVAVSSLEYKLTDPLAFGLVTASPVQRAICRIADGRSLRELAWDRDVRAAVGNVSHLLGKKPLELAVLSGIRTGKSLLAGALAVHWSQTCDVSGLGPGEVPRVSIVSPIKDLSDVVFGHIAGRMAASSLLSPLLLDEPKTDTILVRHPTGRPVEIKVVAGSRAGSSLVARWSAGCIFDEFPRMVGGEDGVVNWDDSRDAVILRLLPGAQIADIGSPWAPFGPAYRMVQEHEGKPTARLVVVRAPAYVMNPVYWTPERVEAARQDPDAFRTDVEAQFATPEEALFSADGLESATRREPLELAPEPGLTYTAAMDPATRGNGWTLVVCTRRGAKKLVVAAREWIGSRHKPLNPDDVLAEMATFLEPYRVKAIDTDQYMGDALAALARRHELRLIQWPLTSPERTERYLAIRTRILTGEVELPPVAQLRTDLMHLRKRVTQTGVAIVLPQTSDGRHCDYAPALMLALSRYLTDEKKSAPAVRQVDAETLRHREQMRKRYAPKEEDPW